MVDIYIVDHRKYMQKQDGKPLYVRSKYFPKHPVKDLYCSAERDMETLRQDLKLDSIDAFDTSVIVFLHNSNDEVSKSVEFDGRIIELISFLALRICQCGGRVIIFSGGNLREYDEPAMDCLLNDNGFEKGYHYSPISINQIDTQNPIFQQAEFAPKWRADSLDTLNKDSCGYLLKSTLGSIDILLKGWLLVWSRGTDDCWKKTRKNYNLLSNKKEKKMAWGKTKPDSLFRNDTADEFWFDMVTIDKKDYTRFFLSDWQSKLEDLLFWGYPERPQKHCIDCKPLLHVRESFNNAIIISENLVADSQNSWNPVEIDGGGYLRLIIELIDLGLDHTEYLEPYQPLLNNCQYFFSSGQTETWQNSSDEDVARYFNGEDEAFEKTRERIEWLFEGARNEILRIIETYEFKKKLIPFEEKRRILNHDQLGKPPFHYLWAKDPCTDDEIEKSLYNWTNFIRPVLVAIVENMICPDVEFELPDSILCNLRILKEADVADSLHTNLLNQREDGDRISIDIGHLIDAIDACSHKVLEQGELLTESEKKFLVNAVKIKMWLSEFSGIEKLLHFVRKVSAGSISEDDTND